MRKDNNNNRYHLTSCAESLLRTDKKHAMTEKSEVKGKGNNSC